MRTSRLTGLALLAAGTFAMIVPLPMSVELQVRRPGETAPRSFRWSLR